jgi:hypothetical protein
MKRFILFTLSCITVFPVMRMNGQTPVEEDGKHTPFQFSFTYPLGTNGIHSPEYTNSVSVNLLCGISRNEKAFTLSGLATVIRRNAGGLQMAGLFNGIGDEGKGCMLSGLANYTDRYKGVQFAGLANITEYLEGVQFAGLFNAARDVKGIQFAGLFNAAVRGVKGVQFAGFFNAARDVKGVQFAGLANAAKNVKGVQIAGLLNVAEQSDYPIAIVNLVKKGEKSISLLYNETGSALVSFRSGGRVTYGILGCGYSHRAKGNAFVVEGGLGAHIRCSSRFMINSEIKSENSISKNAFFKAGYHILPAYRITPHWEIFLGPGISYIRANSLENDGMLSGISLWKKQRNAKIRQIHIGYSVGIQFVI